MKILRIFNYGNASGKLATNFRRKFMQIKRKKYFENYDEIFNQIVGMFHGNFVVSLNINIRREKLKMYK